MPRIRSVPVAAIAVLLLVITASCGDADSSPPGNSDATDSPGAIGAIGAIGDLHGTRWVTASADDVDGPQPLVRGSRLSLDFVADGHVGASAGCNSMGGSAEIADGRLVVDGGLAMTEMACPGLMEQERWYADFLAASPTISIVGGHLVLAGRDGDKESTIRYTDESLVDGPDALTGVSWRLEAVTRTDASAASAVSRPWYDAAWLRFGATTRTNMVRGSTGCNTLRASYEIDGDRLRIGDLALTRRACQPARMRLERRVVTVLRSDPAWSLDPGTLSLTAPSGRLGLQLTAATTP